MDGIEVWREGRDTIRVIGDREAFSRMQRRWDAVVVQDRLATLHVSHLWLDAAWAAEPDAQGRIVMIEDRDGAFVVAPLVLRKRLGGTVLEPLGGSRGDVPMIREQVRGAELLRSVPRRLGASRLSVEGMPAHSPAHVMLGGAWDRPAAASGAQVAVIDARPSWQEYVEAKGAGFARACAELQAGLEGLDCALHDDWGAAGVVLDVLGGGAFLKMLARRAAAQGSLRTAVVARRGRPLAAALSVAWEGTLWLVGVLRAEDEAAAVALRGALAETAWHAFEDPRTRRCDLGPASAATREWATATEPLGHVALGDGPIAGAAMALGGLAKAFKPRSGEAA